jgi:signal peptidase II
MHLLWITVIVSCAASFIAKLLADAFLPERVSVIGLFAGLQPSHNPGIAFGITLPWGLHNWLIPVALILIAWVAWRSARTAWSRVGFGLIIGGALGNVIDRIPDGVVTDFFQVGTFPIFNVADSCISVGVVVLLLEMVLHRRKAE